MEQQANKTCKFVAEFSNQDFFVVSKPGQFSFLAISKKELWFFFRVGRSRQDRIMASRMEA
jgi:hypothetical protein